MLKKLLAFTIITLIMACGSSSLIEKTKNTRLEGYKFTKIGPFFDKYPEFKNHTWKQVDDETVTFEADFKDGLAPFYSPVKLEAVFKYTEDSKKPIPSEINLKLMGVENTNPRVYEIAKLKKNEILSYDYETILDIMKDKEGQLFAIMLSDYFPKKLIAKALRTAATSYSVDDINTMITDGFSFEGSDAVASLLNRHGNKNEDELVKVLEALLKNKANPNALMSGNKKPIGWAFDNNKNKIFELLIKYKADGDVKLKNEEYLLAWAAQKRKINLVKQLLENGTNPDVFIYGIDWTVLQWAINEQYYSMVKTLLDNKANVNMQTGERQSTALMLAVYKNDAKMVKLLLKYNPKKELRDYKQNTALHIAEAKGYKKIIKLLK